MDKEEIKDYIKENLKIETNLTIDGDYIEINLLLEDVIISTDQFNILN